MLDPTSLFTYERGIDSRTIDAHTLVVTLGAFADSGNVQHHLNDQLLETAPATLLGTFDADQLIDYTGIRPEVTLEADHFVGYKAPSIELFHVTPTDAPSFLVLKGPEPNFQWERMAHSVRVIVDQLGVTRTIVANGFPAATPHTRPVPITRYAGDPSDLIISSPMPGSVELRSSFTTLLTIRLAEAGHSIVGLAVHVPTYAHELDYLPALPALLSAIESAGGPRVTVSEELSQRVAESRAMLDAAMDENEQLRGLIGGFEENYARMDDAQAAMTADSSPIPGAEELTDEVESFLRGVADPRDDTDGDSSAHPDH